jgi:hypothetical protein
MSKVLYIDYENVQNINLSRIAQLDFKIWLFTGTSQNRIPIELVKTTQAFGDSLKWIQIDGNGPNALDFHIAYYLGLHASENTNDEYIILSKDKGFDPLIKHVIKSKIRCRRISAVSEIEVPARSPIKTKKAADTDRAYAQVVENLGKIQESKRPRNRKTLKGHIKTLLGSSQTEQKVDQVLLQLFASKAVAELSGKLTYHL